MNRLINVIFAVVSVSCLLWALHVRSAEARDRQCDCVSFTQKFSKVYLEKDVVNLQICFDVEMVNHDREWLPFLHSIPKALAPDAAKIFKYLRHYECQIQKDKSIICAIPEEK